MNRLSKNLNAKIFSSLDFMPARNYGTGKTQKERWIMGGDHRYYYNFKTETELKNWQILSRDEEHLTLSSVIAGMEGDFVFLAPCPPAPYPAPHHRTMPRLKALRVNGISFPALKSQAMYVHEEFCRYGIDISLQPGENILIAEMVLPENGVVNLEKLSFSLIPAEKALPKPQFKQKKHIFQFREYQRDDSAFSTVGWQAGTGRENSPGRFGFSKGDGLLDCAMPALGIVDKMFLCGQPKYQKPYRWSYSLLPEGMGLHSSYEPCDTGIEKDSVTINHLHVCWSTDHNGQKFSCTYSLASPGILTENESGTMRLSGLRFAGNYQSILIPRTGFVEEASLDDAEISGMAENWILLYDSTEFPDVPLLLVFDRNPSGMKILRGKNGRLESVCFDGTPLMFSSTPFGIQRFEPGAMPVEEAVRRCRFWSRAFLAYPVKCCDYFQLDESAEKVTIRQKFEYRYVTDAWGTEPLELAPVPPPVTLCGTAELDSVMDFAFPTKYGNFCGRIGSWSDYRLPFMPLTRKFPLRDSASTIPETLREGFEPYRNLVSFFDKKRISYPYAGALLEPFSMVSSMLFFMDDKEREFLLKQLDERMELVLDKDVSSDYTVIDWSVMMSLNPDHDAVIRQYEDPAKKHIFLKNWYDRKEPFTGVQFTICYLNLYFFSDNVIKEGSREEIFNLKVPLIENDWGAGLTFYYIYLAALATGSFREIRKHWDLVKKVYSFFDLMHDWACMGTGYSDNGITWVEGANYGLFPAYIRMAEAVGDSESRAFGIYNAAKQLALRLAVMKSSQKYFPEYFDVEPWYNTKFFHEESNPNLAFQNVPVVTEQKIRPDSIYNFTTEGIYPETYLAMRRFGGEKYSDIFNRFMESTRKPDQTVRKRAWWEMQQYTAMLIDKALDENCPPEDFHAALAFGLQSEKVIRSWRGIHIFSRALPENYFFCQLLAWMEMRDHKLWLEHWEEMRISSAVWKEDHGEIEFRNCSGAPMRLECGVREMPSEVYLNDREIPFRVLRSGVIEIRPENEGKLQIFFRKPLAK